MNTIKPGISGFCLEPGNLQLESLILGRNATVVHLKNAKRNRRFAPECRLQITEISGVGVTIPGKTDATCNILVPSKEKNVFESLIRERQETATPLSSAQSTDRCDTHWEPHSI